MPLQALNGSNFFSEERYCLSIIPVLFLEEGLVIGLSHLFRSS